MASIMNDSWEEIQARNAMERLNEGAAGTAAKAGAVIGVGAGIYGGIKQHRLDKIAREEKALRWTNIKNRVLSDHNRSASQKRRIRDAKREAELAKYKKMKRDYDAGRNPDAGPSLKERILGRDDTVDEGVVAPALAGYAAYKVAKGIVKPIVKKVADDRELAEYEHERAFGESPKDSVRRVLPKRKPKNESVTGTLSKVW